MNYINRIAILAFMGTISRFAQAQEVNWNIRTPLPNSVASTENLFIALQVENAHPFTDDVHLFLDNHPISGNLKINGNKLSFLYMHYIPNGKHRIRVEAKLYGLLTVATTYWDFFVGQATYDTAEAIATRQPVRLNGAITADNRNEWLTGSGQALRQEPAYTRTLSVNMTASYKNAEIPISIYTSSDNRGPQQTQNHYQVGFRNRWLDVALGDLNPVLDQLIMTGVRVRGIELKVKNATSSASVYYGEMASAQDGYLQTYTPGSGYVPSNLVNDSQFIVSGTYKRTMLAARLEKGNKSETFRIALSGFKAKDDMGSIKYGLAPKDNLAVGVDLGLNLLHKMVHVNAGIAGSVFTRDITNGALNQHEFDSLYQVKLDWDPSRYHQFIILNASTLPTSLKGTDYLAYYTEVNFTNKYQSLSLDYRRNGPSFYSLGNPFLRTNYDGFSAREHFSLLKRKIRMDLRYQHFSNNLSETLPTKIRANIYTGNISVTPGNDWPTFMLNLMQQYRNSTSNVEGINGMNDVIRNYMLVSGLNREFWGIKHYFRIVLMTNDRSDRMNPTGNTTYYNGMIGISENVNDRYFVNADVGKTIINGADKAKISDINVYNLSFDWHIRPQKFQAQFSCSNNRSYATGYSGDSYRLSLSTRFEYRFWHSMNLDLEGGYQPYRDQQNSLNNYNESYLYLRYTYNIGNVR